MKKRIATLLMLLTFLLRWPASSPAADALVALTGHVSEQTRNATRLADAPPDEAVHLSLMVNVDAALLDQTLTELYRPNAAAQNHFLSSEEFAERFSLADKREKLKTFARDNGFTVDATDPPTSLLVSVSGHVSDVEKAFHIHLNHYRSRDGRLFRSHETEPQIPVALAPHLSAILGLNTLTQIAHPHLRRRVSASRASPAVLTGMTGPSGLAPADIKTVYGLSTALDGSGQSLALFELDGYTLSDITHYESHFGLPATPLTYIGVDGQTNSPGLGAGEVTLDMELVIALSPGLSHLFIYGGPNTSQGILDTYDKIATDNSAKNISTSWGLDEQDSGSSLMNAENTIFKRMATQRQTIFAASGDCGAYDQEDNSGNCITTNGFRVDDPASQPFVTGAGGTSLSGTVASPTETTWNEFGINNGGTGGGVSVQWSMTSTQAYYQLNVPGTASQSFRNVPDVALNADPDTAPYAIYFSGAWQSIAGTSAAAPLWAAMTALINQARVNNGEEVIGFINPSLYTLAASTTTVFNDITTGNNAHYSAGTGYDNATGLGSFKGNVLLSAAANITVAPPPTTTQAAATNVYAFPNPWDARNRQTSEKKITFANVPDGATVKIFTLAGFWIKTLTPQGGQAPWDLTNDSGRDAASGLYLYLVEGGGVKVKGKIALIR